MKVKLLLLEWGSLGVEVGWFCVEVQGLVFIVEEENTSEVVGSRV